MKEHVTQQLEMLKNFLTTIKAVALNPYSKGIDAVKLINDILDFTNEIQNSLWDFSEAKEVKEENLETQPDKEEKPEVEEIAE